MSCERARSCLAKAAVAETIDARKVRVGAAELGDWFAGKRELVVLKGKKIARHRLPLASKAALAELVLGPTGNLRAPTLVIGDLVVVGFEPTTYRDLFAG
jgi:arsenate reductase-like glutaredoxin family protein